MFVEKYFFKEKHSKILLLLLKKHFLKKTLHCRAVIPLPFSKIVKSDC